MPDSKRQKIVTAIDTALKNIKTSQGYETDLGDNVFEWREEPLQETEIPGAIWRDTDAPVDETFGEHLHKMILEVELFSSGASAPALLRKLIADVVKMIGANLTWGGLAEDTRPQTEDIKTDRESKRIGSALLKFEILYLTARFDPYA